MIRQAILSITLLIAVIAVQPAMAFDKNDFIKDIEHAKAVFAQGKQQEAISYWEKLRPKYGSAQGHYENELGNFYSNVRTYDKAEKVYLEGVALNGKYPPLYIGLAFVYLHQDRFAEAEKWAKKTVEQSPSWWKGYYALGQIDWKQNNFISAKTWLKKALEIDPQALTYWLLGIVAYELKDPQTVVQSMEAAINLDRSYMGDEHGMPLAAIALAQLGRYKDAYEAIETLKKNNPKVNDAELQPVLSEIKKLERQGKAKKG